MSPNEAEDVLRGLTLKVYKFVLRNGKPTGIREVQRSLKLSSPTLALYHLNKLEEVGLLKKNRDGYVVNRVFLQNSIRLSRILVPRFFFYSIFFLTVLVLELTLFKPATVSREYLFGVAATCIAAALYLCETIRILLKKGL